MHEGAEEFIPKKKRKKTTIWLSEKAVRVAEERRAARATGQRDKVKILDKEFQKLARESKEDYLAKTCKEMEDDGRRGKTREMFAKVKMLTGKFTPRMGTLRSGEGNVIKDEEGVKERWREYTEELYTGKILG